MVVSNVIFHILILILLCFGVFMSRNYDGLVRAFLYGIILYFAFIYFSFFPILMT
jgi:hypothetical protein